jgi:anti-anti-sigma factor
MPTPPGPSRPTAIVDVDASPGNGERSAKLFRDTLRRLLAEGYDCILVNLALATYIDSALLGAIVQGYISATRVGTTVKLLHASRRVKELLAVTKLDRVLETVNGENAPR